MMIAVLVGLVIIACGVTLLTLHALCMAAKSDERNWRAYEEIVREDGERAEE